MEEILLQSGLKSSTIEILIDEGFETADDLAMLDEWSFQRLNLSLQQTLILRGIVDELKLSLSVAEQEAALEVENSDYLESHHEDHEWHIHSTQSHEQSSSFLSIPTRALSDDRRGSNDSSSIGSFVTEEELINQHASFSHTSIEQRHIEMSHNYNIHTSTTFGYEEPYHIEVETHQAPSYAESSPTIQGEDDCESEASYDSDTNPHLKSDGSDTVFPTADYQHRYNTMPSNASSSRYGIGVPTISQISDTDNDTPKASTLDSRQQNELKSMGGLHSVNKEDIGMSTASTSQTTSSDDKYFTFTSSRKDMADHKSLTQIEEAYQTTSYKEIINENRLDEMQHTLFESNSEMTLNASIFNMSPIMLAQKRHEFRERVIKDSFSMEKHEESFDDEVSTPLPPGTAKEQDLSKWLNESEHTPSTLQLPHHSHTASDTDLPSVASSPRGSATGLPTVGRSGSASDVDVNGSIASEAAPPLTPLLSRRHDFGSTKSLDSMRSGYSGYFSNTDPDYVNDVLSNLRPKHPTRSAIPAVIIDLSRVQCMYVEEGCLYLTPKANLDEQDTGQTAMAGISSLFFGMGRGMPSDDRSRPPPEYGEQDYASAPGTPTGSHYQYREERSYHRFKEAGRQTAPSSLRGQSPSPSLTGTYSQIPDSRRRSSAASLIEKIRARELATDSGGDDKPVRQKGAYYVRSPLTIDTRSDQNF